MSRRIDFFKHEGSFFDFVIMSDKNFCFDMHSKLLKLGFDFRIGVGLATRFGGRYYIDDLQKEFCIKENELKEESIKRRSHLFGLCHDFPKSHLQTASKVFYKTV